MKKIKCNFENKNSNSNKSIERNALIINHKYFSIELIPYNQILKNLMYFLQKKLTSSLFNEAYKYFINEIKKYINLSSLKNLIANENIKNINKSINLNTNNILIGRNRSILSDYSLKNNGKKIRLQNANNKRNLKKNIKPLVGLSYSRKFEMINSKKNMNSSSFSNLNFNNLDINFIKGFSSKYNNSYINSNINNTLSNSNSISQEKDFSYYIMNNNQINTNISYLSNNKETHNNLRKFKKKIISNNNNKFKMNEKLNYNKSLNNKFNTINTSIHKNINNNKLKKVINNSKIIKENNSHQLSNNTKKKISNNKTVTNIPHQNFTDINNKNSSNNKNKAKINSINSIKNAVVINNTIFNKYKNNYNFGLLNNNNKKKLKIINIKLQNPKKNNGGNALLKQLQNSEEMLKKIKNSLDDDNLKVMLNFSYENFLSKESERESKEYSVED